MISLWQPWNAQDTESFLGLENAKLVGLDWVMAEYCGSLW